MASTPLDQAGRIADAVSRSLDDHADQHRPLAGYGTVIALFNGLLAAGLVVGHRRNRLPERFRADDLVLLSVASYKLSRLITKSRVASAVRAPFTRFQGDSGHGEVDEAARGSGLQRSIGELLVCPGCMGQWVSAGFLAGSVAAPRETRAVAALFSVYAMADGLQLLHVSIRDQAG